MRALIQRVAEAGVTVDGRSTGAIGPGLLVLVCAMQGDPDDAPEKLAARGLAWPTVVDESGAIASRYGLAGVPALAVIDADGRLRTVAVGYTTALGMRARLWWASLVPASGAAGGARKTSE